MKTNKKIVIYRVLTVAVIAAVAVISVGIALSGNPDIDDNTSMYLTLEDNGSTVSLNVGDTVNLTLKDYGDGGYIWGITKLNERVLNITDRLDWGIPEGIEGDFGYDTWIFTADDTGTTTLELACSRLWDDGDTYMIFTVGIEVK